MAFLLCQTGTTLNKVDVATGAVTALTLPTGVTLSSAKRPHFAILGQWVVMVNSPSVNLAIDPEGTVRVLVPRPPTAAPSVVAGSGTGLTGAYLWWESFVVTNGEGATLMESPLSPSSRSLTLANTDASLSDIEKSLDSVSLRRIYRSLAGGTDPYHLTDVDGNSGTTFLDAIADATLELLPLDQGALVAPPGTVPGTRLKNIVEWKSRLWAIADDPDLIDSVFVTETNKIYAWPHELIAYPTGQNKRGLVGFAVRQNELGLLKPNGLWKISSSSSGTGINIDNISIPQIAFDKAGCESPETIVSVNDTVFWLGRDGVYLWNNTGVHNISDDTVAPWFKSGTYFNRAQFSNATARWNEVLGQYELHLAAAGSSDLDRWVSYNVNTKAWYGPHKTGAITPTAAAHLLDADGLPMTVVGASDGVVYTGNSSNKRDGAATAIDMDCYGPWHSADAPDIEHFWGQLSMLTKVEAAGTLTVTPTVGRLDSSASTAITHTLTTGRELLRRLGDGALCRLRLRKNTVNQSATIYGYEIAPVFENGRR